MLSRRLLIFAVTSEVVIFTPARHLLFHVVEATYRLSKSWKRITVGRILILTTASLTAPSTINDVLMHFARVTTTSRRTPW